MITNVLVAVAMAVVPGTRVLVPRAAMPGTTGWVGAGGAGGRT